MKQLLIFLLSVSLYFVSGQNIVPNPDFENLSSCPSQLDDFPVVDWIVPTEGTADYFHTCGGDQVDVPDNIFGSQPSATGDAYTGVMIFIEQTFYREYIQVELETPTIAGGCYNLSLYYSRADQTGSCNGLGMLLSDGPPANLTGQIPQLVKTNVADIPSQWEVLNVQYISPGGETHLTIGNFSTDENTQFTPGSGLFDDYGYYYIDSVAVEFVAIETTDFEVDLGPDLEVCENDFPVTLISSLPNAYNVWSNGEVGPTITVNEVGEYFVQSFISCEFAKDSITISLLDTPQFDVADEIICSGDPTTISVDESLGSYVWEDGSSGPEFIVTEEGIYGVTLTYECGEVVDQFDVGVIEQIDIPEPSDLQFCDSELPIVISDFIIFDDGINEFLWQDGSESPGIIVFDEGLYSVEISNDCFSDFVDFNVEVQSEIPTFVNFADTIICAGEEVLIDLGLFGFDFLWQDDSTLPFFLAPGPGEYYVTVSNLCGSEVFDFEIDEAVHVSLDLGEDISICPGDSVLISAPDGQDLMWSNGDVSSEIWIKEEGEIIAFSEGICSQISDTINIFLNGAEPQIDLPDSLVVCMGDTIELSASPESLGVEFTWNTGSTEISIPIFNEGIFIVSGENNCGITSDSVVVTLGESIPDPVLEDSYEICAGDTIDLQIETNGGVAIWSTGSTDSFIQVFQEGSYFVSLTNSCATKEDSTILIFAQELDVLDLGADFGICEGDSMTINAGTFNGSYVWNTGSEEEFITVTEEGLFSLQINGVCNMISDTVEVTSLGTNPVIDLGEDVVFCDGDSVIIGIGTANVDEVLWNTSSTNNSISIFTAGTYIVVGNNICGMDSDTIVAVINNEVPQIDLGEDQQICPGDSVNLDLGNVAGDILWNTGDEGSSIEVFEEGEYFAVLTSACGSSEDTVLVEVLEAAPEIDLGMDQVLCFGESLDFALTIGEQTSVLWNNGAETAENSFDQAALIWVELSNACGVDVDSVILQIIPEVSDISLGIDVLLCDENSYFISPFIFDFNVDVEWNTGEMTEAIEV
ncbi:hypothetical protein N9B82_04800, partial [Saprospiraceae bacterium]|nr:hypothetical protein [Saprospiraceae bacterium]